MGNKVMLQEDDTFMFQTEPSRLLEGDYIKRGQGSTDAGDVEEYSMEMWTCERQDALWILWWR